MKETLYPGNPILIVDDEEHILKTLAMMLRSNGYTNLITTTDSREVMPLLHKQEIDLILLDLTMPHISGEELLKQTQEEYPFIPVIIVTGTNEIDTAVNCIKAGAIDYMVKAVEENRLISGVRQALANRELRREFTNLKSRFFTKELSNPQAFSSIITRNEKMYSIFLFIETIAPSHQTVLVTGETGTGKELIAEAIHELSTSTGELVKVNIAGLDDTMFSDTLFGHKKGAFTGATESRKGLIEAARNGTLFLDEIGDLSSASQVKLLRLLEAGEYFPLGSDVAKRSNTRLVVATNRDVTQLLEEKSMRKDLYYRINTHSVEVPPLRKRKDDLPLLVDHFISQAASDLGKPIPEIPMGTYDLLQQYHFPGNVRELRSLLFDAVSRTATETLNTDSLQALLGEEPLDQPSTSTGSSIQFPETLPTIKEATEALIREALSRTDGNQARAARLLGITPQALSKRLASNS
jgi:DNA-binding NtrC family response regulator